MPDPDLFHGIAVLIDDEIHKQGASIKDIQKAIEGAGCHVIAFDGIPNENGIANLRGAAFFVLDWNLYGAKLKEIEGDVAATPAQGMAEVNKASNIQFLRELKKVRFAPVFIFTNESVEDIEEALKEADLYAKGDEPHILVKRKQEVIDEGIFNVLATWVVRTPSVYVLKKWEAAYEKAKNEMFRDFYLRDPKWPLIMWKNFQEDSVPPAPEMGELIGSNLVSRMMPFSCNLSEFSETIEENQAGDESYDRAVRKVLEGERFLAKDRLDENSFEPGDIFDLGEGRYRINIRPHCDCIARGNSSLDKIELYLLKGREKSLSDLDRDSEHGLIREPDNEAVIYPVSNGKALCFKFKDLCIKKWKDLKGQRVGRLLPPFLTRLQQRYSSYLQRPGLSRLPSAAFPPPVASAKASPTTGVVEPKPAEAGSNGQ